MIVTYYNRISFFGDFVRSLFFYCPVRGIIRKVLNKIESFLTFVYNYVNKCRLKEVNNVQFLKDYPRKRIELAAIEKHYGLFNYQELYQFIQRALQQGDLEPVKASGSNGKKPALYKKIPHCDKD